jgi:hypothetical protein
MEKDHGLSEIRILKNCDLILSTHEDRVIKFKLEFLECSKMKHHPFFKKNCQSDR